MMIKWSFSLCIYQVCSLRQVNQANVIIIWRKFLFNHHPDGDDRPSNDSCLMSEFTILPLKWLRRFWIARMQRSTYRQESVRTTNPSRLSFWFSYSNFNQIPFALFVVTTMSAPTSRHLPYHSGTGGGGSAWAVCSGCIWKSVAF